MSIASTAAQQSAAASSVAAAGSTNSNTALASLSSNFGDFLKLLMTQLQNQDPSSPMDANQFTNELVQFASVQQQINTNTSLTQLIQLTQAQEVMQSSSIIGKQATVQSTQLALQDGQANIRFTAPSAEPVAIAVYNSSGVKVSDAAVTSVQGQNNWSWDGKNAAGARMPDGAYTVVVTGNDTNGGSSALPFSVLGKVTGVTNQDNNVRLQLGALSLPFSAVQSVAN